MIVNRPRNSMLLSFIATALLIAAPVAQTQEARLAVPDEDFAEGFTGLEISSGIFSFAKGHRRSGSEVVGASNVSSGGVLVGLSIGSQPAWTVDRVSVALPPGPAEDRLCFRVSGLGGRFWSDNPYVAPVNSAKVVLGPLTRKYKKNVSTLPKDQLVFRTALPAGGKCEDLNEAQYLPVIYSGDTVLIAHINSGGKTVASRLDRDGTALGKYTICESLTQANSVAADRVCKLNVADISGMATLHLLFWGSTGKRVPLDFSIYVPRHE